MERAPLPPHERPWRHPSELAADARQAITDERPSGSTRTAALFGATATILLFGVAILSLTPTAGDGPAATGSTPIQRLASATLTVPSTTPALGQTAARTRSQTAALGPAPTGPLAAEIGTGGLAVLPSRTVVGLLQRERSNGSIRSGPRIDVVGRSDAAPSPTDTIVVTLHSGVTVLASVIDVGDGGGLAVVHVEPGHRQASGGFLLASDVPDEGEVVTVLSDEPITVVWQEISDFDDRTVADGTAVVDSDGDLVGIYADEGGDGGRVIVIDDAVAGATTRD